MISGQNDHIIGIIPFDKIDILIDCVCRAFIPIGLAAALIRGQDTYASIHTVQVPRLTAANVLIQQKRLILCKYTYTFNTGIDTV